MTVMKVGNRDQTALEKAVRVAKPAFGHAIFLGLFINILALVAPLYMMQVYGRVIMSRNMTTLLMLTLVAGALLVSYALLEAARSRMLVRAGILFDRQSSNQVFDSVQRSNIINVGDGSSQGLRDLDRVREYLTGNGLIAICDAPWAPIFILGCFMLHPWYGFVATAGAIVLFILGLLNNRLTRTHLEAGSRAAIGANHYATTTLRNAEATRAMGMMGALRERWQRQHEDVLGWQALASERSGAVMAVSKFIRMGLQIAILGVGAYLVVTQNISAGSMIAASIMMGRALAPVEQAVGNWRGLHAQSVDRRQGALRRVPAQRPG